MKLLILLLTLLLFALLFASCAKEEQPEPEDMHPYAYIDYTLEKCETCGDFIKVMYISRPDGEMTRLQRNAVKDVGYTGYVKRVIVCTGSFSGGVKIEIGAEGEHIYYLRSYKELDSFVKTL